MNGNVMDQDNFNTDKINTSNRYCDNKKKYFIQFLETFNKKIGRVLSPYFLKNKESENVIFYAESLMNYSMFLDNLSFNCRIVADQLVTDKFARYIKKPHEKMYVPTFKAKVYYILNREKLYNSIRIAQGN